MGKAFRLARWAPCRPGQRRTPLRFAGALPACFAQDCVRPRDLSFARSYVGESMRQTACVNHQCVTLPGPQCSFSSGIALALFIHCVVGPVVCRRRCLLSVFLPTSVPFRLFYARVSGFTTPSSSTARADVCYTRRHGGPAGWHDIC